MAIKDFDFKQFLLHHGERVGIGVAGCILALLLVFGVAKVFSAGSPGRTATEINTKRATAKNRIDTSPVDANAGAVDVKTIMTQVNFDPVDPDNYRPDYPFFTPSSVEDTKRRNPEILSPTEGRVDLVLGPVRA